MYCSNCGMKLPDWAHYCERCGTRLKPALGSDDPLEQVGLDDTSASEPLWDDEPPAGEPALPEAGPASHHAAPDLPTVLMNVAQGDAAEAAEPADPYGVTVSAAPLDQPEPAAATDDSLTRPLDQATLRELADDAQVDEPADDAPEELADDALAGEPVEDAPDAPEELAEDRPAAQDAAAGRADDTDQEPQDEQPAQPEAASEPQPEAAGELPLVDAGDQGGPTYDGQQYYQPMASAWQGRQRPSERRGAEPALPVTVVAGIAAGAILVSFLVAFLVLGGARSGVQDAQDDQPTAERVSKREAQLVIDGLAGWWTTDRTLDGRYWQVADGVLETYAADGELAGQQPLDPEAIEHLSEGPGGIDGAGYYLRDVAFYLRDDDPDTLYAIDVDGTADESANLFRTDPPPFSGEASSTPSEPPTEDQDAEAATEASYILPDSSIRVYETSELEPLTNHELFIARNEIYARHGYVFEPGELADYFAAKNWYWPSDSFNEADITEVERENVGTILALEQARGSEYV